jgi:GTPase SAR1 family protein
MDVFVVFCGDALVGKTALIHRIVYEELTDKLPAKEGTGLSFERSRRWERRLD